jgi:hypothetical protein
MLAEEGEEGALSHVRVNKGNGALVYSNFLLPAGQADFTLITYITGHGGEVQVWYLKGRWAAQTRSPVKHNSSILSFLKSQKSIHFGLFLHSFHFSLVQ